MLGEKISGPREAAGKKSPEPLAADLASTAGKPFDGTSGVFQPRFADGRLDSQPVPNRLDFTEGNAGLHHAERTRIHPQKNHLLGGRAVRCK